MKSVLRLTVAVEVPIDPKDALAQAEVTAKARSAAADFVAAIEAQNGVGTIAAKIARIRED